MSEKLKTQAGEQINCTRNNQKTFFHFSFSSHSQSQAIKSLENKKQSKERQENEKIKFWFATGGAGFCISRALAIKMMPLASNGRLVTIGDKIRFPDDVTLGFIVDYLLKVPLTVVEQFHSHLERMDHIDIERFRDQVMIEQIEIIKLFSPPMMMTINMFCWCSQISFSYAFIKDDWNVVRVDGFDAIEDPYRFYSLHCYLFPYFDLCKKRQWNVHDDDEEEDEEGQASRIIIGRMKFAMNENVFFFWIYDYLWSMQLRFCILLSLPFNVDWTIFCFSWEKCF